MSRALKIPSGDIIISSPTILGVVFIIDKLSELFVIKLPN